MAYTYTPFGYKEFKTSTETGDAKGKLTNADSALSALGDFNWDGQGKYDTLIQEYENRPDFSYDFNADAIYQQYKDKYIQQGKMAMADTIGQASAMTGGYGNSYAATVGNQAYQASLQNLNDIVPELYQMAYDQYNQDGQDMLNMIGLMGNERDFAYGQHNDKYTKLANDRDYWGSMYNNLYNRDYTQYSNDRTFEQTNHNTAESYKYQADRDATQDAQWQAQFDETVKNNAEQLALQKEQFAFSKQQYEEAKSSSGGDNAALQYVKSMSSAELVEAMQGYNLEGDNTGLAAFLDDCVASGRLTNEQADQYYEKYMKVSKKPKVPTTVKPHTYERDNGRQVDMVN